jgi:predicted RNA-binding protein YlxR (DUF448 family)
MRTPNNDSLSQADHAKGRGKQQPERRCVITGEVHPAERLVRLALGPDGVIAPDVLGKAPGRGAWIGVDQETLIAAQKKGKLKGGLARALQDHAFQIPDDLAEKIVERLQWATLQRLGLESRAGNLITGSDRIDENARRGSVRVLMHARDAGDDGRRKLGQAWRVGRDEEGSGQEGIILPVDRGTLSMALGRENAVHIAITDARAAERVLAHLSRWQFFTGWSKDTETRDLNKDSRIAGAGAASMNADTAVSDAY